MAVVPPEFQVIVLPDSFVTAELNVRVLLEVTVRVLDVGPVQSKGELTVTVPALAFPEAVEMVTLQVPRFARRFVILTVAVAGFAVGV